jgi:hypothetical protein
MPRKGDDHLRRAAINKAKQVIRDLPGSPKPTARDKDEAIARATGKSVRYSRDLRRDAEAELQAEQAGGSGSGIRYLDDLADLVERAELLFSKAVDLDQLSAASAALKQLHALRQDQSTWRGERPPEPGREDAKRPVVFTFADE